MKYTSQSLGTSPSFWASSTRTYVNLVQFPMRRGRKNGCKYYASPNASAGFSESEAVAAIIWPEDLYWVDAYLVDEVISGKYPFKPALRRQGFAPIETIPCLEGCRSINVRGLSGNATEEDLRSLCSNFGTVTDVKLFTFKNDRGLGRASITFKEATAAQQAQSSCKDQSCLASYITFFTFRSHNSFSWQRIFCPS